jgi:MoaA/NifB/PqqE/SkfB family radical SAM enzyme
MPTAPSTRRAAFEVVLNTNRAFLTRTADARVVAQLGRLEAVVLKLQNAYGFDSTRAILEAVTPHADELIARVHYRFNALLAAERGVAVNFSLEQLSKVDEQPRLFGLRDLPGPRVLHWTVTRFCPRRCAYCYAEPLHGSEASDSTLTRSDLLRIFEESASLGAQLFVISGSEPFLRDDLPEIMGDALRFGITPSVTTKHPIGSSLAERIAAAGVKHISISLDTVSPTMSHLLIGSRRYPSQVMNSVSHLANAGVRFSFQAVVTRLNAGDVEELARFAAQSHAVVLQLVPFDPVRRPISRFQNQDMALEDPDSLRTVAERLSTQFPTLRVEVFSKSGDASAFNCDIGMTKLFFLPDGTVHRCYKLADDVALRGKSLRDCTVAEAWHDPQFGTLVSPPQQLYQGSPCGSCARFSRCHADGRCLFQSSVANGSYYGVDRGCSGPH